MKSPIHSRPLRPPPASSGATAEQPLRLRRFPRVLSLLAFCAGYVEAATYLGLGHVFTANMTGNSVLLGIAVIQLNGRQVVRSLTALVGFCAGVMVGVFLLRLRPPPPGWPHVRRALAAEALTLLVFAMIWTALAPHLSPNMDRLLIVMSGIAMGIQTDAARRISTGAVSTTYITGTFTDLSDEIARRLRCLVSTAPGDSCPDSVDPAEYVDLRVWVFYLIGAGAGGFATFRISSFSLFAPTALILILLLASFRRR